MAYKPSSRPGGLGLRRASQCIVKVQRRPVSSECRSSDRCMLVSLCFLSGWLLKNFGRICVASSILRPLRRHLSPQVLGKFCKPLCKLLGFRALMPFYGAPTARIRQSGRPFVHVYVPQLGWLFCKPLCKLLRLRALVSFSGLTARISRCFWVPLFVYMSLQLSRTFCKPLYKLLRSKTLLFLRGSCGLLEPARR